MFVLSQPHKPLKTERVHFFEILASKYESTRGSKPGTNVFLAAMRTPNPAKRWYVL
jgi:hypothetical protein